jgi:hypothetical protein
MQVLRPTANVAVRLGQSFALAVPLLTIARVSRAGGKGELYAYLPLTPTNTARLLAVPPESHQNADYGISVGRGAWRFAADRWTYVAFRVKLNDVGADNGVQRLCFCHGVATDRIRF